MIRKLLILSLAAPSFALAQITITSADMPNAGDSILVSLAAGTGSVDPTVSGGAVTWDFSTVTPNAQRYEKFDSPLTFTSPFNLLFNPFNTSYGKDNYQLTSLPIPGVTLSDAYDFFKESSSSFKRVGAGYTINGTPLPFIFSQPDIVYSFPMNFGNIDSCDYKYGLPIPTIGYYGETGHRVNSVDGWGTLITPYATYNALRVTSVITAIDTVNITAFGIGTNIPRPLQIQYKWFAPGSKVPAMEVDGTTGPGGFTPTNVQYIDTIQPALHVGISEMNENRNVVVYPNPMDEQSVIRLSSAIARKIDIIDIQGRLVRSIPATGLTNVEIKRSDLPAGLYFYRISCQDSSLICGKIILR